MKIRKHISLCSLTRSPGRTTALVLLSVLLSFAILGGSLMIYGLKSGLNSLEARLGADIMVVPYEATTKSSFSNMVLQGNPGYFYMDKAIAEEIRDDVQGIGQMSEQFYLASASASCCSVSVQIIGFNPETDFTIQPWISGTYKDDLNYMEIVVGSELSLNVGDTLSFYGTACTVAAKMDATGTYLDASVYADEETIKTIIASALEKQIYNFGDIDPDEIVSCVLIDVAEGYTVQEVADQINLYCKGVSAVQTESLVSDVSSGIAGIAGIVGALIVGIWLLALLIQVLAFLMIGNERRKEFAIYRVLGASRSKLASILFGEAFAISLIGSLAGAVLATAALSLFGNGIETALGMPFLLPGVPGRLLLILAAAVIAVVTGCLAASYSALRISRQDTALILRREN